MEDIHSTLTRFLTVFSKLNLDEMMTYFSDDATAFFPIRHHTQRLNNKEAIKVAFKNVINRVKAAGLDKICLDATEVKIQQFNDVALVTFLIIDNELNRRTILLRKKGNNWVIEHLHASNAPLTTDEEAS